MAAVILKKRMERMGCSTGHQCSTNHNALSVAGGPDPLNSKKGVPGQCHAIGELRPDQKVPRQPHAMGN